jgi:phage tail protein X
MIETLTSGRRVYRTGMKEFVDQIGFNVYGRHVTEALLSANPGLADLGVTPPINTLINLPDLPDESVTSGSINLWD